MYLLHQCNCEAILCKSIVDLVLISSMTRFMSIFILTGSKSQTKLKYYTTKTHTQVRAVESARDLGVVIDSQLSHSAHVTALCRSGYYYLRQLRPAARSLSTDTTKTLVQAFISCRLDYCNSLMSGMTDSLVQKIQSVRNAAAQLVSGASRRDHIMPVLRELHWLPVRQ